MHGVLTRMRTVNQYLVNKNHFRAPGGAKPLYPVTINNTLFIVTEVDEEIEDKYYRVWIKPMGSEVPEGVRVGVVIFENQLVVIYVEEYEQ